MDNNAKERQHMHVTLVRGLPDYITVVFTFVLVLFNIVLITNNRELVSANERLVYATEKYVNETRELIRLQETSMAANFLPLPTVDKVEVIPTSIIDTGTYNESTNRTTLNISADLSVEIVIDNKGSGIAKTLSNEVILMSCGRYQINGAEDNLIKPGPNYFAPKQQMNILIRDNINCAKDMPGQVEKMNPEELFNLLQYGVNVVTYYEDFNGKKYKRDYISELRLLDPKTTLVTHIKDEVTPIG